MQFIDQTEIWVQSGDGGDGMSHFRRARNKPKLGPDGGSGGNGGSVYFTAELGMNTLATLRYKKSFQAEHGNKGGCDGKTGASGADICIPVPLGTIFYNAETQEKLGELTEAGTRLLIAKGGERGLGNAEFVTSIQRAPRQFTHGTKGVKLHMRLELKVLADIGLAGFPNAGKSTLLSRISQAKPKIADYPFTTLHPILGVVEHKRTNRSFVVADIPGLIEGASQGKGLGFEFLRHLERNKIIAYVLDSSFEEEEVFKQFQTLQHELFTYNRAFEDKLSLVVLNKSDLIPEETLERLIARFKTSGLSVCAISAATGDGLDLLIQNFGDALELSKTDTSSAS